MTVCCLIIKEKKNTKIKYKFDKRIIINVDVDVLEHVSISNLPYKIEVNNPTVFLR